MRKLSFLELEKEMQHLSRKEASMTKGGGENNPIPKYENGCYFNSVYGILDGWGFGGNTNVGAIKDSYDAAFGDDKHEHPSNNGATLAYVDNFTEGFLVPHLQRVTVSKVGEEALPNNYDSAANDQYIVSYVTQGKNGKTEYHSVVYMGRYTDGRLMCKDFQYDKTRLVPSDAIVSIENIHKPQTTLHWFGGDTTIYSTTLPSTTIPTSTSV